jgi:hypothetical protein
MASVYKINKGINKPIEFKGLKAQYITYLAIGLIFLLIFFAAIYISGLNMFVCLALVLGLGTVLFMAVFRMSRTYGQYGLMKLAAKRRLPGVVVIKSRKGFLNLKKRDK